MTARHFSTVFITITGALIGCGDAEEVSNDFSADPRWEGYGNQLLPDPIPVTRQDFGWHSSSRTGGKVPAEIGGWIQRSIAPASYAKAIPVRTLGDRLSASGTFTV